MTDPEHDKKYMQLALRLARKGAGYVSPNPLVGAVFVREGAVIGRGYHGRFGGPHAEINALNDAGGDVRQATLYCTLEPCSHTNKKTPPCAQRLVKEQVRRVVIATLDPNPEVNGAGVKILQDNGIAVTTGLLEKESREMNRFFFRYMQSNLPYIMVKIAQTLDGFIARERTVQSWITNSAAQNRTHRWRSEFDAVLIGIGTLKSDNPQLTVRTVKGRNPLRILIDRDLEALPDAAIFDRASGSGIIVFTRRGAPAEKLDAIGKTGAEVIQIGLDGHGRLPFVNIMQRLHARGLSSVMVEGGQKIFTGFLRENLADELRIIIAPVIWGSGIPAFGAETDLDRFRLMRSENLSDNLLLTFRRIE